MSLTNASPQDAAKAAKISSRTLAVLSADSRNAALQEIHDALSTAREDILTANARDLEIATKSAANGELSQSILKRLDLSRAGKFDDMLKGILDVKNLEDPGESISRLPLLFGAKVHGEYQLALCVYVARIDKSSPKMC